MTASLSWLDYSEHERQKFLHVIDMFREQGTVDELGIGTIRDAFADMLFPGTSTIQTRAGYFLFVPWMYREFERQKVQTKNIVRAARNAEIRLIDALVDGGEREGVIGIDARRTLKRLPSNVYWNGLLSWGIRLFPGSQPQYQRSMDSFNASPRRASFNEDNEATGDTVRSNWHPYLPPTPAGFPTETSFELRLEDAAYLSERIVARHPHSMLAFLVGKRTSISPVAFPWEQPRVRELPLTIADQLRHAQCFSESMHGASLLYNLMLAQALANEELVGTYASRIASWAELVDGHMDMLTTWDRAAFWQLVAPAGTNTFRDMFVNTWLDLVLEPGAAAKIASTPAARKLIDRRETQLKGGRSRLHNERALALWNGFSGADMLSYRWRVTQNIVMDIQDGLGRDA